MKNRFTKWLKKVLGITQLENEVRRLHTVNEQVVERHRRLENLCGQLHNDNSIILNHVKMINKDFSVVADINIKYEPSVVIVMRKYQGQQDVVKTYTFRQETVEQVYRFLEGFGEENVRIDQGSGRRFKGPNFLY